jgi:hypothetical protein
MLVYGDIEATEAVGDKLASIQAILAEASRLPPGVERHAALVTAFISTSELVQGLIDAEFQARGFDARSSVHDEGMRCLAVLGRCVAQSWRSGFARSDVPASFLRELSGLDPAVPIRTKRAEGYAFYALYPESFLQAAAQSSLGQNTRVIGIRSIGAGLGALVAAAIGAPPAFTVRPVGHPFRREVKVDPAVTADLVADEEAHFAVVDEGPGLSGSSFGAVADWLESAGVLRERIHFFPSHAGELGPQASEIHRDRWRPAARHVVDADDLLLRGLPEHQLSTWIEEVVGPLESPLEDISGGTWRAKRYSREEEWPAANVQQERRKFLTRAQGRAWLVKFVGLGEVGLAKYRHARHLHEAGFTPEVAGYRHGFIVERWHEDARSLDQDFFERDHLVEQVGSYLGLRARQGQEGPGASLSELRHMAVYNTQQALGEAVAAELEHWLPQTDRLKGLVRRIVTDNRMQAWEWLVMGNHLLKTDAIDHSATHDLVGHQDVTWDIAGAAVELEFTEDETRRLCGLIEQESGHRVAHDLLPFMRGCYLAFQSGAHLMAAGALGEGPEAARLRKAAARYASLLQRMPGMRLTGNKTSDELV